MEAVATADLTAGRGIAGNADQGGKRQITIIEEEMWGDLMKQLGAALPASARRANLLVKGIRLENSRGRIVQVGNCQIRINGETRPCGRMDEALLGLKEAMSANWAGGVYGEVLNDGRIHIGDKVCWSSVE